MLILGQPLYWGRILKAQRSLFDDDSSFSSHRFSIDTYFDEFYGFHYLAPLP